MAYQDVKASVDQLLAHMEVAAEKDMEANKQGQPAVMKLKMLTEVGWGPSTHCADDSKHGIAWPVTVYVAVQAPAGWYSATCGNACLQLPGPACANAAMAAWKPA